jgi:hypothetical protein
MSKIYIQHSDGTVEGLEIGSQSGPAKVLLQQAPRLPLVLDADKPRTRFLVSPATDPNASAFVMDEREPASHFTSKVRALNACAFVQDAATPSEDVSPPRPPWPLGALAGGPPFAVLGGFSSPSAGGNPIPFAVEILPDLTSAVPGFTMPEGAVGGAGDAAWNGAVYCLLQGTFWATLTDGVWATGDMPGFWQGVAFQNVAWIGDRFLAVGYQGGDEAPYFCATAPDGKNWTPSPQRMAGVAAVGLGWDGGDSILTCQYESDPWGYQPGLQYIYRSTDKGQSWEVRNPGGGPDFWDFMWDAPRSRWLGVSLGRFNGDDYPGGVYSSDANAAVWTLECPSNNPWQIMPRPGGGIVALGSAECVYTVDGEHWTSVYPIGLGGGSQAGGRVGEALAMIFVDGNVFVSTDGGASWSERGRIFLRSDESVSNRAVLYVSRYRPVEWTVGG